MKTKPQSAAPQSKKAPPVEEGDAPAVRAKRLGYKIPPGVSTTVEDVLAKRAQTSATKTSEKFSEVKPAKKAGTNSKDKGIGPELDSLEKKLIETLKHVDNFAARHLEYRIKAGRLLIQLKDIVTRNEGYGTWESRCRDRYHIEPRTARNYMKDAQAADTSPDQEGTDKYANEVADMIEAEKQNRAERGTASPKVIVRMTLAEVSDDKRKRFQAAWKQDRERVDKILRRAFEEIIKPIRIVSDKKKLQTVPEDDDAQS